MPLGRTGRDSQTAPFRGGWKRGSAFDIIRTNRTDETDPNRGKDCGDGDEPCGGGGVF